MMKPPRLIAVLPTMLTLANAACGFGAITFAAKLGPVAATGDDTAILVSDSFKAAALIFMAMVFDMLDGSVARLMKQTSELGAQLDSLCDAISFGVAPAFLMLQFVTKELQEYETIHYPTRLLWTIAVLYALCAILRLARFNVESEEEESHDEFSGLPSPAAAGTIIAFPFAISWPARQPTSDEGTSIPEVPEWLLESVRSALPLIALAVACLMVSRIRYPHYFAQLFSGQRTRRHVIQLVFTIAVVFWVHELAVPLIFSFFAFATPVRALWMRVTSRTLYKSRQV